MTTSVIPWGVFGQLITVAVGAVCMLVAIYARDGSLAAVASDPSAAVVIAFLFSLGAARWALPARPLAASCPSAAPRPSYGAWHST
jgi:hypothetical protein